MSARYQESVIDTQKKLEIIQRLLEEKKAENLEILNVENRTLMAYYFVVCSGTSNTHIKTLADTLALDGKKEGLIKNHVEGYASAKWVLVDFGDIVVHIFAPEEREFYDIESLWRETAIRLESAVK